GRAGRRERQPAATLPEGGPVNRGPPSLRRGAAIQPSDTVAEFAADDDAAPAVLDAVPTAPVAVPPVEPGAPGAAPSAPCWVNKRAVIWIVINGAAPWPANTEPVGPPRPVAAPSAAPGVKLPPGTPTGRESLFKGFT